MGTARYGSGNGGTNSVEDVEAEVAAAFGPLVVLLGQDGADEARDGIAVGGRSSAIQETCDFDELVIPRDCTSLSIRRVDIPSC